MATVTRYINTGSTAGGDGTTNATSGANRAYASMNEWEGAEQTDLVTDTDNHIVYCDGTSTADTTLVDINGWTMGASNGLEVIATPSHNFTAGDGYTLAANVTYNPVLHIQEDYVKITGIEIENTTISDTSYSNIIEIGEGTTVYTGIEIINCLCHKAAGTTGSGSARGYGIQLHDGATAAVVKGNVVYGVFYIGIYNDYSVAGSVYDVWNNTAIVDCTGEAIHLVGSSTTRDVQNNIAENQGSGNDFSVLYGTTTFQYNLSSDTTSTGTGAVISTTLTYEDAASDIYRLDSGDTSAIGAGNTLTAWNDPDGDARSAPWDMGADVYVAVGSVIIPLDTYFKTLLSNGGL